MTRTAIETRADLPKLSESRSLPPMARLGADCARAVGEIISDFNSGIETFFAKKRFSINGALRTATLISVVTWMSDDILGAFTSDYADARFEISAPHYSRIRGISEVLEARDIPLSKSTKSALEKQEIIERAFRRLLRNSGELRIALRMAWAEGVQEAEEGFWTPEALDRYARNVIAFDDEFSATRLAALDDLRRQGMECSDCEDITRAIMLLAVFDHVTGVSPEDPIARLTEDEQAGAEGFEEILLPFYGAVIRNLERIEPDVAEFRASASVAARDIDTSPSPGI